MEVIVHPAPIHLTVVRHVVCWVLNRSFFTTKHALASVLLAFMEVLATNVNLAKALVWNAVLVQRCVQSAIQQKAIRLSL